MKFPLPILFVLFACNSTPASKVPAVSTDTVKDVPLPAPVSDGNFTFLEFDTNGDEYLFIICKDGDTLSMIYNTDEQIPYKMGDDIHLVWKDTAYSPAGDPESSYNAHFVQKHALIKEGPLSGFLKRYALSLSFFYEDNMTEYAKDIIYNQVCNYLATTTREPLRSIVDKQTDSIVIDVKNQVVAEKEGYVIRFKSNDSPLPQLFINFEERYRLHEYDSVSLKPAT